MARTLIPVQNEIFVWARERRGYDRETAAAKLDMSVVKLGMLEEGVEDPSPAQIRKAADVYLISPAAFFLPEVPVEGFTAPHDFRTLDSSDEVSFSPELRKEIDRVRARRAFMEELSSQGFAVAKALDFSLKPDDDVETSAWNIRWWLGIEVKLNVRPPTVSILATWIEAVEDVGVLVSQVSGVPTIEMRGFCLSDRPFPMIVLNGGDSESARLFTLIHELIHVLAKEDGICNARGGDRDIEFFCNAVAAATIIPRDQILANPTVLAAERRKRWTLDELAVIARPFGASREAVIRRLLTLGRTTQAIYEGIRTLLLRSYSELRKPERGGGPPTDVIMLRNLGRTYVRSVLQAHRAGYITRSSLSDYFFGKLQHADAMAERLGIPIT